MSIFPSPSWIDWTPTVSTALPMTATGLTLTFAKYALDGSICYVIVNGSFTVGGTAGAQFVSLTPPIQMLAIGSGGIPFVVTIVNAGFTNFGRGRFLNTTNSIDFIRNNGPNDIAWVLGVASFTLAGFFPV